MTKEEKPITECPDVQRLIGQTVVLQAENMRLRKALHQYGEHTLSCQEISEQDYEEGLNPRCTCGFEQALKKEESNV